MVNRVVLVGRLTKDPELKKSSSDTSYAIFSIAVDNRMKDSDGTRGTLFLNCRVFGAQAENMFKQTRKGSKIAVDGSLNQRNFERKDGTKGKDIEVIVDNVTFLDPKSNEDNSSVDEPKFDDAPVSTSENLDPVNMSDDDLPF